jgi:hypothetical protein
VLSFIVVAGLIGLVLLLLMLVGGELGRRSKTATADAA